MKNKEPYEKALESSGFDEKMSYSPPATPSHNRRGRTRKRKILWFNPPYNSAVKTDIGWKFLNLLSKHFPKDHKYAKLFNQNTVKLSYSCMPSMSSVIASHNKKILTEELPQQTSEERRTCNCRTRETCPMDGNCLDESIIYKATVTTDEKASVYFGSTEMSFKQRYAGHKASFAHENLSTATTLSKYVWSLKKAGTPYSLRWEIHKHCSPYKCGTRSCDLCLTEKYVILHADPDSTLNKHSEIMQKCRHKNKFKLKAVK